jgi:predicted nuclease of predicted toxin-antitoxin system
MARPIRFSVIFDEQMSSGVARALACLGKSVTYVGARGQVRRGSSDLVVARSARRNRRVILTVNFDMVMSACDAGVRFIWFDQRGRSPTKLETAFIMLRKWEEWETALADPKVACIKVGRQKTELLSLDQARKRASRRFQRQQSGRKRTAAYVADRTEQQARLDLFNDE